MFVQDRTTHGHYPSLFDINHLFMALLDIGYNYGLYNQYACGCNVLYVDKEAQESCCEVFSTWMSGRA